MAEYTLSVPSGAQSFEYGGSTYGPGSTYTTSDPCEAIAFYNAARSTNPSIGRQDGTRNFWAHVDQACTAQTPSSPQPSAPTPPNPANPTPSGGDTPGRQGAPGTPPGGNVGGNAREDGGGSTLPPNPAPGEEPTRPTPGTEHPGRSGEQPRQPTGAGDPVDLFNGALYLTENDLEIPNTVLPLLFIRYYRSGGSSFGPFGWNWDHNHNLFLRQLSDGNMVLWRDLHEDKFVWKGDHFEPPRGKFEELSHVSGLAHGFDIVAAGGTTMRFNIPAAWSDAERIPLLWIKDRHGHQIRYSYNSDNLLSEVQDDDGRYFRFTYNECKLISSVSDQAGRIYSYHYDYESRHLVCLASPPTSDHPEGVEKYYSYNSLFARPELRHNILRITDSTGHVYLENKYEEDPAAWSYARLTEQLYGGYHFHFNYNQLQYVMPNPLFINIHAVQVEVANPEFGLETYTFNYRGDLLDRRFRLFKDKSYRVVIWQYDYDEQGNLAVTTRPNGSRELLTYDALNSDPKMRGNLLQKEITAATGFPSPSRIVWKGKYEPVYQQLTELQNEAGHTIILKYDLDVTPADPNNSGKLMEVHLPDATLPNGDIQKTTTLLHYNANALLDAIDLPDGKRNELKYGSVGNDLNRLIEETRDVAGIALVRGRRYDSYGYLSQSLDGKGTITTRVYNALGQVEKLIRPEISGRSTEERYHYNEDGYVTQVERPIGNYTKPLDPGTSHFIDQVERNVLGFATKLTLSSNTDESRSVSFCNNYRGMAYKTLTPDEAEISRKFDERGLTLEETIKGSDGTQLQSSRVYNPNGDLILERDVHGSVTKYEYDGFSRLHKILLPNGSQRIYQWLHDDLLLSEEVIGDDGNGSVRQLEYIKHDYDEKSRRIRTSHKTFTDDPTVFEEVATTFYYDAMDRVTKIVNPRDGVTIRRYDGIGRLVTEIDPEGNEEHFEYDLNDNIIEYISYQKEPGGAATIRKEFEFDARDRQIAVVEPDGARVTNVYDDRDLVVEHIDHLGIRTTSEYDSFNKKMINIYDVGELNIVNQWTYDIMSRTTAYIDPMGERSEYRYDSVGRLIGLLQANGFSSRRSYNEHNQIFRETLASGVQFEYQYDSANRLSKLSNPSAPAPLKTIDQHQFHYDGMDRITRALVGSNQVLRQYDSRNRLIAESTHGDLLKCQYDDKNGTVRKEWPDGRIELLSHDQNGVLESIEQVHNGSLGSSTGLLVSFQPSGMGALGQAHYRGNVSQTNLYDERKRLSQIAISSPSGLDMMVKYRYDSGNQRRVEGILGSPDNWNYYEFDARRRISLYKGQFSAVLNQADDQSAHDADIAAIKSASTAALREQRFRYDQADARTVYSQTAMPDKHYSYGPGHKILSDGVASYSHFTDGTLKSDGSYDYEIDALGRIVTIKSGSRTLTEIDYDALGRPSRLNENGTIKTFNYFGGFIEQENTDGVTDRHITLHPLSGVPIAYHSSLGTHYTLVDARFNLIALLSNDGRLQESYRYGTFGEPEIFDGSGSPLTSSAFSIQPIFGGLRYLNSGLYLAKKRLMDPKTGLFLSPDPKGYEDSPNLYGYTIQNPIDNIDPNGEIVPFIVAAFVIGGALAGAGYSFYDAYHNPRKYEGFSGTLRVFRNVFGGAIIGGAAVVAGEAVLALGGTGLFASGTAATTLTAAQTFVLYGTSTAVTGSILRYGFNNLFPEHVGPVTPTTMAFDYVAGGGFATALRALAPMAMSGAPGSTSSSTPRSWGRFWADAGGEAPITGNLGPYPGKVGAFLDKIGIRQGYSSTVNNFDAAGSWFARTDTGWHEGFHVFVARYFPTFRNLSHSTRIWAAAARYPEEVLAYSVGHSAALRFHGVPFAPIEAFGSLSGYTAAQQSFARWFWGIVWGGAAFGTGMGVANASPNSQPSPNPQTTPNEKPPDSK